jgi:uncharacterized protein YdeI (YjbR/CyaY-like superfamily)
VTVRYFRSAAALRRWLAANHARTRELWIGFYKKGTGKASVTYHEALDEALCVGWIDGVRKRLDGERYVQRFTPRKPGSYWSAVNTTRATALIDAGRMTKAGLAAFEARDPERTKQYSFERDAAVFPPALERTFKANRKAWAFFEAQPPSYRRTLTWYVVSAKRDETKQARLSKLVDASAAGRRLL